MKNLIFLPILLLFQSDLPDLNNKVVAYVKQSMGKTIGSGECWDLAAAALEYAGAYHDRTSEKTIYVFGKPVDPLKEKIYPGDIIQMKNIKLQYKKGDTFYTETMVHHTAIVYKVNGKGDFEIAHQNTGFSGRKVGISHFRLEDMKGGKATFYRPQAK